MWKWGKKFSLPTQPPFWLNTQNIHKHLPKDIFFLIHTVPNEKSRYSVFINQVTLKVFKLNSTVSPCFLPFSPFVCLYIKHSSSCSISVKRREALMCFTAMTWSTSCSTTTLWSPWWLRISQPTWRQWGSCPKVATDFDFVVGENRSHRTKFKLRLFFFLN